MSTKSASVSMKLVLSPYPPVFDPAKVDANSGDAVDFGTSDDDRHEVTITHPDGKQEAVAIPSAWTAPDEVGDYGVAYSYKGGTSTGNINIGVGGPR